MNYGLFSFPSGHVVQSQMRVLIADITITANDVFDIPIPRGFDHLQVDMMLRSSETATAVWAYVYLNGDKTATNYTGQYLSVSATSVSGSRYDSPNLGTGTGASATAGMFSYCSLFFPFVSSDSNYKHMRSIGGEDASLNVASGEVMRLNLNTWESTDPITRIQIEPISYPTYTWVTGSRVQVFGIGTFPVALAR